MREQPKKGGCERRQSRAADVMEQVGQRSVSAVESALCAVEPDENQ
jgi:hypothetical protein